MAIKLQSTRSARNSGAKIIVYGQAGAGKTTLILGLDKPLILSAENGLKSISGADMPDLDVITISSLADFDEACAFFANSEEGAKFKTLAIDSISEIAEVCLRDEKSSNKDPRAAYGNMQDLLAERIRALRDLEERDVFMTAKVEAMKDELGQIIYSPSMPGAKMGQSLPYFFDEIYALKIVIGDDGKKKRVLQTQPDGTWQAKSRARGLLALEDASNPEEAMGRILRTIRGVV